jgi:hypothetical protein
MPKNKYIKTPEELWEHFCNYRNLIKANPIIVVDFVGSKGQRDERPKERPLTVEGFENYLEDMDVINNLSQYFANTEGRYGEYQTICSRIKRTVRTDQIEGGMAGIYNPSITQRLNGLVEKTQNENINREVPLFPDVSE